MIIRTLYRYSRTNLGYRAASLDENTRLLVFATKTGRTERAGRTKASKAYHTVTGWCMPVNAEAEIELGGIERECSELYAQIEAIRERQEFLIDRAATLLRPAIHADFQKEA